MPRLVVLLAVLSSLSAGGSSQREGLDRPLDVIWRARDGHFLVADEGGRSLLELDAFLQPLARWNGPSTSAQRLMAFGDRWWALDQEGRWWQAASAQAGFVIAAEVPLALERLPHPTMLPGGRRVTVDEEGGHIVVTPASWERSPVLEWGPGWAAFEVRRAARLGPVVEWEDVGGERHQAQVVTDPSDPLVQRAHLEPLEDGEMIRLRWRTPAVTYPPTEWSDWHALEVPVVEPAGVRPRAELRHLQAR